MSAERAVWWRIATGAALALWIALAAMLMIADVWDETNGMLAFSGGATTLSEKLHFVLTQSLGFWRPLPTLFVATVLHLVPDFDTSWRLLRAVNIAMLLCAILLIRNAVGRSMLASPPENLGESARHRLLFVLTIAILFSGSGVITASWYANIFDASALLLIAFALWLLVRDRPVAAGCAIAAAFFCKETAVLALPFLLVLFAARRVSFSQLVRAAVPAVIGGAVYFAIRSGIVPFGSGADVHTFAPQQLWPTVVHVCESFWRQTLKGTGPGVLGFAWLALSIAALRRPRLIAAALTLIAATIGIYWGMFGEYQNGVLMHHLNFVGRLYLVPAALTLVILALERRTIVMTLLLIPIVTGGYATWRDHARFQSTYDRIYTLARETRVKPLTIHYPPKPLHDTVRGIRVGDIPDAEVQIEPRSGRIVRRVAR